MLPGDVIIWLRNYHYGEVISKVSVGGGCINNGLILETTSGQSFFLKTNSASPKDMFAREAKGLEALKREGTPRVPEPYLFGSDFLLLENLAPVPPVDDYWVIFGRQLANLHNYSNKQFGFYENNYIGRTPQINPWMENGFDFFIEARLLYMAGIAREKGYLNDVMLKKINQLAYSLSNLVPEQPPSLIHGDLWSGNAITDSHGDPAIIDPAVHYGWAEAELAMTTLFGSFPGVFYKAYEEIHPLEAGYQSRFPIYNLYHLLNHVVLFGHGYLRQVDQILSRF